MPNFEQLLHKYYGYPEFRPGQKEIIDSVWEGKDTLALLPTGGGKSICYQIPALAKTGTCLVVTALIALMKDQVRHLRRRNISAAAVFSGMSAQDVKKTFENTCDGVYKFLFVSPERLQSPLFREYLPGMNIQLLVVDEAHCISQWGYDFRPPYLKIAEIRSDLAPDVPVLALTATATPYVQQDIMEKLGFRSGGRLIAQSFARPNLSFSVFRVPDKINKLLEIVRSVKGSGLVYCRNRRKTAEIAHLLQLEREEADFYHAGLPIQERNKRQDDWINNRIRIMVCTNAFGMGIDKPDVRSVVHMDVPDSLEAYYQEAGRAGRDGKRAYGVMLFTDKDVEQLLSLPDQKFLPEKEVQKVYDAVANYLQVPYGHGEGQYFPFDFQTFCTNFNIPANTSLFALQALQAADYLSFNEQILLPSKIEITASRETMEKLEKTHPELDDVLKTLLRSYEGIMDIPVRINERFLAGILKKTEEQIVSRLKKLAGYQIIQYAIKTDAPQIYYSCPRVPSKEVIIESEFYWKRKQLYISQIEQVANYLREPNKCRSSFLRNYFGDASDERCGICDNCLNRRQPDAPDEMVMRAAGDMLQELHMPKTSMALRRHFISLPRQTFEAAIDYLLSEEKIKQTPDGKFFRQG